MTDLGPATPQNWYLLGPASRLRAGEVISHSLRDFEFIVYRPSSGGAPVALAAHCAHMGCHLGTASVRGDRLRCPLHYRLIDADGRFAANRDGAMHQRVFPVKEYAGGLFVFLGNPAETHDLDGLDLAGNPVCYAGEHRFDLPWQSLVANGLDIEHLLAVHDRKLLATPTLDVTGNHELRVRYQTKPTAAKWSDVLMARLASDGIHGSIRSVCGSMLLVEARVGRRENFILMSFLPQKDGGTLIRGLVGMKGRNSMWNAAAVRVARALFKAFLFKDLEVLKNLQWHEPPQVDGLGDEFTQATCAYFRSLAHA
jgi:nitrite reductase/ring-hydroxylating ferredoxin subunit